MKPGTLRIAFTAALLALPLAAWADRNPDFDDDAKPILRMQPNLLRYVHRTFEVKDTGVAKYPGSDDRRPAPPYLFRARPRGSSGPYYITLLIQPGPLGRILKVIDPSQRGEPVPRYAPGASAAMPPPSYEASAANEQPAPANPSRPGSMDLPPAPVVQSSSAPTSDTPSGPIPYSGNGSSLPATSPSLAPPPDPAPSR